MIFAKLLAQAQKEHLRTEMEVFLSHLLGTSRLDLIAHSEEEIPVEFLAQVQKAWVDLKNGVPVAYLTHEKEFYGHSLYVDERVLVPRPCTEQLVDWVLEVTKGKVLELGTGSGAIAIALKKTKPSLEVTATDISEGALEVANKNCVQAGVEVNLLCSDLLNQVPKDDFDTLVTNLPYIGTETHAFVDPHVQQFEPAVALFGGKDGLELYRRLFEEIVAEEWGFKSILGEFGFSQGEAIRELAETLLPDFTFTLRQDLEGLDRHFLLERKSDF